ncbi:MAG: SH3 domain-containing protein [Anaerolineae bacterium]
MLKKLLILAVFLVGVAIYAQEATPESTAEATEPAEITPEATSTVDDTLCPALVNNALELTQASCDGTRTNEACYGYIFIDAELRSPEATFTEPGDVENVVNIQSLQLSPLDTTSGQWGVIVLSIEPNTTLTTDSLLPDDDLQIILYGDTQLSDASQFAEVTANSAVNIRQQPRTNATVIGSLDVGETIIANGRLPDDSWFRVRISGANEDGSAGIGWIAADFLDTVFDANTLPVITIEDAENPPDDLAARYGPMQAFIFESGDQDAPCAEAPNSGMLIQTPEGVASVTLWLDEVVIQLDGTGVISAQANGDLTVGVIEGTAEVEANGGRSTAIAGQAVDVPLDGELAPSAEPGLPRPVNADEVQGLPTDLLDDPVEVPQTGVTPLLATASGGFQWQFSYTTQPPYICSDGTEVQFESAGISPSVSAETDAIVISGLRYTQISQGVYSASYTDGSGNLFQDIVQIIASDRLVGERVIDFNNPICTITISFSIQLGS